MSQSTVLPIARTIFNSERYVPSFVFFVPFAVFVAVLIVVGPCDWLRAAATDQLTRLKEGIGNSESNFRTVVYPQSTTTVGNPLAAESVGGSRLEAIRNDVAPVIRRVSGTLPASSTPASTPSTDTRPSPSEPPRQNPLRISSSYPAELLPSDTVLPKMTLSETEVIGTIAAPPHLVSQIPTDSTHGTTSGIDYHSAHPNETIGTAEVVATTSKESPKEPPTEFSEEEKAKLAEKYAQLPSLLEPPSKIAANTDSRSNSKTEFASDLKKFIPVVGALCLVLGCFFVFVLIARKATPKNLRGLPKEAFEILGRTTLTPKIQLHLLRLGHHLALVSVTADGIQTVAEITEPDEVTFVLGILKQNDPNSSTMAFNRMLAQYSKEPTQGGYFGTGTVSETGTGAGTGPKSSLQRIPATVSVGPPTSAVPVGESLASFLASGGVRR